MKKKHNSSHTPSPVKQQHKDTPPKKNSSNFDSFSQSFFAIFTEKDKRESQIYDDIKCVDASKEYKL